MEQVYNKRTLGLVVPAFLIHNIEEIISFKSFTLYYDYTDFTYTSLALGITLLSAFVVVLYRFADKYKFGEYALHFNAGLVVAMLLNAFFPHILGAIYLKAYVPGLITAIVLILPFAFYFFKHEIRPNLHIKSLKYSLVLVPVGILLLTALSLGISLLVTPLIFG